MKKIAILLLALWIVFGLFSCQNISQTPNDKLPITEQGEQQNQGNTQDQDDLPKNESIFADNKVYQKIATYAESDVRYRWIQAFLDGNTEACIDLSGFVKTPEEDHCFVGYDSLESLKFGDFSVQEKNRYYTFYQCDQVVLEFNFEVLESECEAFPIGEYSYEVDYGRDAAEWCKSGQLSVPTDKKLLRLVEMITPHIYGEKWQDASNEDTNLAVFLTALDIQKNQTPEQYNIHKDQLKKIAFDVFGISDFVPLSRDAEQNGEYYSSAVGGGFAVSKEIVSEKDEGNFTEIVVQFFSDAMKIVKSHKVKYVFQNTDDFYRLTKVETLKKGAFEPYVWKA
ncbi:MAG: hypothetical protein IKV98_01910 [Clostridia bacterium]|nr:hypothetical protein [Clostridia bacterium]